MSIVHVSREATVKVGFGLRQRLADRRCERADRRRAAWFVRQFNWVMHVADLAEASAAPQVTSVTLGPAPGLSFQPLPGQMLEDFVKVADRIAAALHVARVRLTARRNGLIRLEMIVADPLATPVARHGPVCSVVDRILLGRVDSEELLSVSLRDTEHIVVQGQTRSGKSRWVYGLLGQLASADDVIIAGSDNSGVLLRPFEGSRHAEHQVLGADDLEAHVLLVESLVEEMQGRIDVIPANRDTLSISTMHPLIMVVLEEYMVLLDLLGAEDAQSRPAGKLLPRFRGAVRALLAGGAKVGIRLLLITQRADASGPAGIGGFERGQASLRLTFRVDNKDAVRMLHPAVPDSMAYAHLAERPGIALISGPELPYARLRAPEMPDYATYVDLVQSALRSL